MENKHTNKEKNKKLRITCAVVLALLLLFGISGFTVYNAGCKGAEGNATPSDAAVVELTPGDAALAGATPLDAAEGITEEVKTEEAATEEVTTEAVTTEDDTDEADDNQYAQVSDEQIGNAAASGGTQDNSQNKPQTSNSQNQGNTQNSNTQTVNITQQTTTQATTEQSSNAGKTWVEDEYGYVWIEDSPGHYEELPKYEVEYHLYCNGCGQDFGTASDADVRFAQHSHEQITLDRSTPCRGYTSKPIQVQVGTEQIWIEGQGHYEWVVVNPGHWE